jgi:hypothetical protein
VLAVGTSLVCVDNVARRVKPGRRQRSARPARQRRSNCRQAVAELAEPHPTRTSGTAAIPLHPVYASYYEFAGTLG